MRNVSLRRFVNVCTLQHIGDRSLIELLHPHRSFLEERRFYLPLTPETGRINYEQLAAVLLMSESDLPPELTEALLLIRDLATPENMDKLAEVAVRYRVDLGLGTEAEPADVAARLWMLNPDLAERVRSELVQPVPRAVSHFYSRSWPLPRFQPPDEGKRRVMEDELCVWFERHRWSAGCRLFVYPCPDECLFIVVRGQCRRRVDSVLGGLPGTLCFRPQQRDLLGYNWRRGELRVHAATASERDFYRGWFEWHLAGQTSFFPREATYSLFPVIRDGTKALYCRDVEGLEWVKLREVELLLPGTGEENREHQILRANNRCSVLAKRAFHFKPEDELIRAVFSLQAKGSPAPQMLTIQPERDPHCQRDDDNNLVEEWLVRRGFILNERGRLWNVTWGCGGLSVGI